MKNPMTPAGIEPATYLAQHLNHCATAVPLYIYIYIYLQKGVHMLDNFCLTDETCLSERINWYSEQKNMECWNPTRNACQSSAMAKDLVFGAQCLGNELWDQCSLKRIGEEGDTFSTSAVITHRCWFRNFIHPQFCYCCVSTKRQTMYA